MASYTSTQVVVGSIIVIATIIASYFIAKLKKQKEKVPETWIKVGTLKELYLYPLKSGKPIRTEKAFCTNKGLKEVEKFDKSFQMRDRCFLIYTSKDKEVRTARQKPKTVLIKISSAQNGVHLSAPNMADTFVEIPKIKNNVDVVFGKEVFTCTDCGNNVATWLSQFLLEKDEGLRLGYGDGTPFRNVTKDNRKFADYYTKMDNDIAGIFSDLAALHLINYSSVQDVNQMLPEDEKITPLNFRPNFLIEGPKAFEEDKWEWLKIGNVVAKVGLECLRCIETTVNMETGEMNRNREPLRTLNKYRKSTGPFNDPAMGIYLKVLNTGTISEGDDIFVAKT